MTEKNKRYSLGKIVTLVLILLIPGLLHYYLRQTGENIYLELPYLGSPTVDTTKVQPFQLTNQDGVVINFPEREGITVVQFTHSDCQQFGDYMNLSMARVAKKFGEHPLVNLYSISLDSNDTPAVLKQMAQHYGAEGTNWQFLTGSEEATSRIAQEEFWVDGFRASQGNNRIIHSPYFVLLDSEQRIRGYYEFFAKDEVDRLIGEMILLVTELSRENKVDL